MRSKSFGSMVGRQGSMITPFLFWYVLVVRNSKITPALVNYSISISAISGLWSDIVISPIKTFVIFILFVVIMLSMQ